jgi:hypothetical protein
VFRRSKRSKLKENALNVSEIARELAQDKRFRKRLVSAIEHGSEARRRTRRDLGVTGAVTRLANDQALRAELKRARDDLQRAYARFDARRKRSHRFRNLVLLAGLAGLAGTRKYRGRMGGSSGGTASTAAGSGSARAHSLDDLTKEELYARAQEADIPGRSDMSKEELVEALRARS